MNTRHISLLTLSLAAASQATASIEFYTGHMDIAAELEGGSELHLHLHTDHDHDHEHDDEIAPLNEHGHEHGEEEAGVLVPLSVSQTLTTGIPMTGVGADEDIWILPQSNPLDESIPFLGISTEGLTGTDWTTDITLTLVGWESPSGNGQFSLWQADGVGGLNFFFSTANSGGTVNGNNTLLMGAGAGHDHFNWGFSESGLWEIEMTATGTHATLGELTSEPSHFAFNVVPEPSNFGILFGLAAIGFVGLRRR